MNLPVCRQGVPMRPSAVGATSGRALASSARSACKPAGVSVSAVMSPITAERSRVRP